MRLPLNSSPFVSVVIPVFNDADRLTACLNALQGQSYPRDRFEVIVVDNGSTNPVDTSLPEYRGVRVAKELRPGSYAARNRGILLSRGEVIAFTDADCIPSPDWLEQGVACLTRTSDCGLVGGRIEVFARVAAEPNLVELFETLFSLKQEGAVVGGHYAMTANMFTSRDVLDDVGHFDDQLKSGGDKEWGVRVYKRGYRQAYCSDACVHHPARYTLKQLYHKRMRITGGLHDLDRKKKSSGISLFVHRAKMWKPPLRVMFRLVSGINAPTVGRFSKRVGLAMIEFFLHYARQVEFMRLLMGGRSRNC